MTKIIVIRGNSGSGKTTLAQKVRRDFEGTSMIVSQDVVRRDILGVHDRPNNLSIDLTYQIVEYGLDKVDLIVIEGIFNAKKYAALFEKIIDLNYPIQFYYYDLPFSETLKRHHSKMNVDFGEEHMKSWWVEADYLNVENEISLTDDLSLEASVRYLLDNLKRLD